MPSNSRLEEATRITRAATTSLQAGSINKAVTLALDIEQAIPDAGRLLDATSFFNRFTLSGA
ncbi:MAG: hypothetical protein J0I08_04815 [Rhizobiales bacterium]|nr:hypothetical protein [Hyphomicrobiales bacterium]